MVLLQHEFEGIDDKFFTDPDVLDRVPTLLYSMAAIYFGVLLLVTPLMVKPPKPEGEETPAADADTDSGSGPGSGSGSGSGSGAGESDTP